MISEYHHAEDALLSLLFPEHMFGLTLFLTNDGRKRGLWIWLEEKHSERIEMDAAVFRRGLNDFMKELKKSKKLPNDFAMLMMLKTHFDYFFGHRTEASAIRLSWKQVNQFVAALKKGVADEKEKTEEND